MGFKFDGKEYETAQEVQRAKRFKSLENINKNKGLRSRLWNLMASPEQKAEAKKQYESMLQGGSGIKYY